jgi:hypothetical protein
VTHLEDIADKDLREKVAVVCFLFVYSWISLYYNISHHEVDSAISLFTNLLDQLDRAIL